MDTAENAVVIQDMFKIYKEGDVETVALRGVNLSIHQAEFVAITGRSGSGKSTLLNLLGGLAVPSAGHVMMHGIDLARLNEGQRALFRRDHIGIVFQADNLIPFLTAAENVALPMNLAGTHHARSQAEALLSEVGLGERFNHRPNQLSGGERQRVAIAVALANKAELLLADELTGELDSATAENMMALLKKLNVERGLTLIVVTHNPVVASRAARQVHIHDGMLTDEREVAHVG